LKIHRQSFPDDSAAKKKAHLASSVHIISKFRCVTTEFLSDCSLTWGWRRSAKYGELDCARTSVSEN